MGPIIATERGLGLLASDEEITTADVVIVGAGSAGATLAGRLAEDGALRVLVLEAGDADRYPWIHVPIGYFKTIGNPRFDWRFATAPEPGLDGRSIPWPRGKVVGGSSSLNGMLYLRGQAADYDDWSEAGNPGWSWAQVLPYFRRMEKHFAGADGVHGGSGPLAVSPAGHDPLSDAFIAAAARTGLAAVSDFNRGDNEGVGYFDMTTRRGRRVSAARAFLHPAARRGNLRVLTGARALRVRIDGMRAVGVEFLRHGRRGYAAAARQVVLSAGTLLSPQLLQLSGIGPAAHLRAHGIPVIRDLPGVGENLQDHLQARLVCKASRPVTLNDLFHSPLRRLLALCRYGLLRDGPLATGIHPAGAFLRSSPEFNRADLQIHFALVSFARLGAPPDRFSGFTLSVCQLRPESRGTVRLGSADPLAPPVFEPRYLTADADRSALLRGLRRMRAIVAQPPLADYAAGEIRPGADCVSDEDILAYIRETAISVHHQVGTCRMGTDADAVVDARLRVNGISNLRVVDGSVMPTIVSGNTNAPIMMIGDKAADLLRAELTQDRETVHAIR